VWMCSRIQSRRNMRWHSFKEILRRADDGRGIMQDQRLPLPPHVRAAHRSKPSSTPSAATLQVTRLARGIDGVVGPYRVTPTAACSGNGRMKL
jgi:hypothetical protein